MAGHARRARISAGAAACVVAGMATFAGYAAAAAPRAQRSPIQHIVVLYLENHSFDNLLGYWCRNHPGRCPAGGMPSLVRLSNGAVVTPGVTPERVPNMGHDVAAQQAAIDHGLMDGWQHVSGCQPSIRPWSMAACCAATSCPILGTLSGVTPGVTTAPFESLTNDGMPPAGHRPGWFLHQYPRRLSNEWFSR